MDNTKDLIKERLAKIVAEEICKDKNVLEQLKAEILKDLLPALTPEEQKSESALVVEEAKSEPTIEPNKNDDLKTKLANIANNKKETTFEKVKSKLSDKTFDKWKHYLAKEKQIDNPIKAKDSEEFTFNPNAIPNEYKTVISSDAKPKTFCSKPTPILNEEMFNENMLESYFLNPLQHKKLPVKAPNTFVENLFKNSPIIERDKKPIEQVHEEFFKLRAIPPDVAELLSQPKTTSSTLKPRRKPIKKRTAVIGSKKSRVKRSKIKKK